MVNISIKSFISRIFGDVDSSSLDLANDIVSSLDLNKDGQIQPVEFDKVHLQLQKLLEI